MRLALDRPVAIRQLGLMKLSTYLSTRGITCRQFAPLIEASASQVSRWATGKRTPSLANVSRIKRATDGLVTADDFMVAQDARREAA